MLCGCGHSEVFNSWVCKGFKNWVPKQNQNKNDILYKTVANSFPYHVCLEIRPICVDISQIGIYC